VTATTRLKDIVVDARHPAGLARFWATVLGYHVRPYEQDDLAFLASIGRSPDRDPAVAITRAPSPTSGSIRVPGSHTSRCTRIEPLVGLGARVLRGPDEDIDWWVVADPEGNEFCAFPALS